MDEVGEEPGYSVEEEGRVIVAESGLVEENAPLPRSSHVKHSQLALLVSKKCFP